MPRNSKQKKAILGVLKRTTSHPSVDWIYEEVRKEIPNISLGTVYRNLNMLKEGGAVIDLTFAGAPSRYDGNCQPHDHFRCIKCGRIFNIEGRVNGDIAIKVAQDHGFEVLGHRLEYYGFCADCRRCNE